jgi:uroporphyrin-III C-methyltransferase
VTGRVVLVGAGPGDPELITVKGAKALSAADVVVYDRLAAPALLDLAPGAAERIYVGKQPGGHAMSQEEINAVLVDQAHLGRTVVRLKGGDPFVFGRGGEELLACAEAGISCEVIPGITSALSAPASAGIPVTQRGMARSFAVVTASTTGAAHEPDAVDLSTVATATDTLVLLMAARRARDVGDHSRGANGHRYPDRPAGAGRGREHGAAGDTDRRRRDGASSRDRTAHRNASRSRRSDTTGPCQSFSGSGVSKSATFRSGERIRYACMPTALAPVSSP